MSALFGYSTIGGKPVAPSTLQNMLSSMNHWDADGSGLWHDEHIALGHLLLYNSPQSKLEQQPFHDSNTRYTITAAATLFNRPELITALGMAARPDVPDSVLILKSFEKWGKDCPLHFNGSFAFAIWDAKQQELFCARDHHGIKPFYYTHTSQGFGFASEIKGLLQLPFVSTELDETWIADFICRIWLNRTSTLYQHIKRLEPGQRLRLSAQGIDISTYWHPSDVEQIELGSDKEYIEAFQHKLFEAVARRAQSDYGVASELSGGLDSSAVTLIGRRYAKELTPFSYVLPKEADFGKLKDERKEINHTLELNGITHGVLLTSEQEPLMQAIDWNRRVQDEPPKEMNCMFREDLYGRLSQMDIRTLLSGFGGDDIVSHHGSGYLEELARTGQWKMAFREAKATAQLKNTSVVKKIAGLGVQSLFGFNAEKYDRFMKGFASAQVRPVHQKLRLRPLQQKLFDELQMEERFNAYQQSYFRTGVFALDQIRRMQQPHVMYRLELCDIATRSFKVEYRYPLLDIELIELYLSMPLHMKVRDGRGRYVFRKAVEQLLPHDLLWRDSKGGSSNPQIVMRGKIDGDAVVNALKDLPAEHRIHQYADFNKSLSVDKIQVNGQERVWQQQTTHVMNLLLAHKIHSI